MPLNDVFRQRTREFVASLNSHRILLYALLSTVAVSAAVANALKHQSNFYSVTVHLSKSNRSVLILVNFGFLLALLSGHVAQQIFFGPLRAPEIERLYDRLWFFVTESLLAFTIFRDEFNIPFALMFGFLLFIKSFHWLAADRIEWMDQRPYPGPPPLFHVRMSGLFVLLWAADCLMFLIAAEHTLTKGVSGMVLFASEFAILMASALNVIAKYLLSIYELRRAGRRGGENAPPWENKSMWFFYIELATDFLKLSTYLVFFTVIITFYGLPLNIIRDVYITARSFISRLRALHRYQTATRNMDQRYPNATAEEMSSMSDRTCIICREEMVLRGVPENSQAQPAQAPTPGLDGPNTTPKKLPCGHVFHFHCLKSWLERQQSCPTCRRTVLETNPQGQQAPAVGVPAVGVPGPAQPGGVPQQPNAFGIPDAQPGHQVPNNPLGFLGRIFGLANQPPIVPGQFAHGQFAQIPGANPNNHQNPVNLALNAGQIPPGIVVQYHIQFQVPRHPQQVQTQPQRTQPPPARVPALAGFPGPGGLWQPWGMDHRWFVPENVAQPVDPAPAPATATPVSPSSDSSSISVPTPTPTHTDSNPASTSAESSALNSADSTSIHRMQGTAMADRTIGTAVGSGPNSENQEPPTSNPDRPLENAEEPSVLPSPSPPGPVTTNGMANSVDSRLQIPTLIPLYDYRSAPSTQHTQAQPQHHNERQRPFSSSLLSANSHPQQQRMMQSQPAAHQPQTRPPIPQMPAPDPRYYQTSGLRPLISQLPPTLTDDQLAVMDSLTREAIDERLRVLEGVSGAAFRCIDELLRMRSVLPLSTPATAQSPLNPPIFPENRGTPIGTDIAETRSSSSDPIDADERAPDRESEVIDGSANKIAETAEVSSQSTHSQEPLSQEKGSSTAESHVRNDVSI